MRERKSVRKLNELWYKDTEQQNDTHPHSHTHTEQHTDTHK